ncbi:hypothetical protein DOX53_05005 [Cronobacter malonaticus]|uniref:Uncharacterized protein n=1 Tax=Cronobacter malonaticus TaxID=413503 RepID=A0ABX5K5B9_9ENTR|nr:hypothetical protein [Cronobacter malonaticus]EGT4288814.1 hypothetical protein [Cronobacter malonaticus]EGT4297380.1 hypothetical protein [Cronobacter malonaticus]EGT4313415.1 hypothetical protein [Cronobacter malonaticus]EGT4334153.1 hypothetical protein [Cronobacter malonaticus]
MLRDVTGARSVGSEVRHGNQTSGESIGPTSRDVASMFISFFNCDLRNAIRLAKFRGSEIHQSGDYCFRSFLSVISVTYKRKREEQVERWRRGA